MNERPDMQDWEDQVNALMDGELDDEQAEALKAAAEGDQVLARAIIEAYQLQQAMAAIPVERAPQSLQRKLKDIPREHAEPRRPFFFQPRWAMALAAIPIVVAVSLSQMQPKQPSEAEIAQAREDIALVFSYVAKASNSASREMRVTIDQGITEPVSESTIRAINDNFDLQEEQEA